MPSLLAYRSLMGRSRGRYKHEKRHVGWVVMRDIHRSVLDAIDCRQGGAQDAFAAKRGQLIAEGWIGEGRASAGEFEFFNRSGVRIVVAIEPRDPALPEQSQYGPSRN
jgi:hypothetical protein